MAAFDRDPMLERRQIQEISANVARRLQQIGDRVRYAPGPVSGELAPSMRAVADIQHEINRMMAAWPAYEPLEASVLTHVLATQQHALSLLEMMEARLRNAASPAAPVPDQQRTHAALLATARDIEKAFPLYGHAAPSTGAPAAGRSFPAASRSAPRLQKGGPKPTAPAQAKRARTSKPQGSWSLPAAFAGLITTARSDRTTAAAVAALLAVAALVAVALSVMSAVAPDIPGRDSRQAAPAHKLDGRLEASATDTQAPPSESPSDSSPAAAVAPPPRPDTMAQPFLVVLSTRRTTEELQQDYRAFKGAHPDLLSGSKARVDRVLGQDRQTWYRLSLIPPQTRDEAKSLCSRLRAAGLTGCWIKQVPLR